MSKPYQGSLNLTAINKAAREGHSAFSKHENGNIYFSVTMWENDEEDKYGNTHSLQLNPKKDSGNEKPYIGNLKPNTPKEEKPKAEEIPDDDDLPF